MKIVCEQCAARYSIADEKFASKLSDESRRILKIRCKRCAHVMVRSAPVSKQREPRVERDDDTSALFTLSSLVALTGRAVPASEDTDAGSGLIDIRALREARSMATSPSASEELPQQLGVVTPVLAPAAPEPERDTRMVMGLAGWP